MSEQSLEAKVNDMAVDVAVVKSQMANVNEKIETLVHKAEFFPVKLIAYGLAAGALGAVVNSIVTNVLK